ncbi:MAG: hypothetical protein HBSAPP03_04720 [Phycisphaerae bacterium]|nr:MAG: hypothetical protein HBSAPP03_04720 [Phycisphaerae bacterium]
MRAMSQVRRIAVWLGPHQAAFVQAVAGSAGCVVTHAGAPDVGRSGDVSVALGAEPFDDLRAAAATLDVEAFWLAAPMGLPDERAEARLTDELIARGVRCVTTEPHPASAPGLAVYAPPGMVGLPASAEPWTRLAEVRREFSPVRMMHARTWARPEAGSLGARLVGVLDLVRAVLGEPESVDAVYVGPRAASGLHAAPPDTLRDLHGDMAATLRYPAAAAVVEASDAAPRWEFSATLMSAKGRLHVTDTGWEWLGQDGNVVDAHRPATRRAAAPKADPAVTWHAASLRAALAAPPGVQGDHAPALVMAHAALLAARTGQPESPDMIRRLAGV